MVQQAATTLSRKAKAGRTIVVGLGRTGMSCARHLHARDVCFAVTDSRATPPQAAELKQFAPNVEMHLGGFDARLLEDAAEVVVSPGVSLKEPFLLKAASLGVPIIGDIELFAREARAPIAAVTGTNGKSTVTTLVALMAEAAGRQVLAGGNLGRPALDLLDAGQPQLYVLELSSFQLDTTQSLHTVAATVLNVTPDHMDRYATLEEYAASKARIFQHCATAVINLDDAAVRTMPTPGARVIGFSLANDLAAEYSVAHAGSDIALLHGKEHLALMSELKITGAHNAANALAALAMGEALGLPRQNCLDALKQFAGLPHRSQWVADVAGVRYVDDSKGTNVGATLAAVAGMPGSLVLIAGGQGKGQDFSPLADALRGKVRHAVLLGQDARQLGGVLAGVCDVDYADDMQQAVRLAAQAARIDEIVLLSPACASLDMFRDYAHRGDAFAAAVRSLKS